MSWTFIFGQYTYNIDTRYRRINKLFSNYTASTRFHYQEVFWKLMNLLSTGFRVYGLIKYHQTTFYTRRLFDWIFESRPGAKSSKAQAGSGSAHSIVTANRPRIPFILWHIPWRVHKVSSIIIYWRPIDNEIKKKSGTFSLDPRNCKQKFQNYFPVVHDLIY